jgi:radical SAM protein with 4Fe4S-binding SPASM domain
MQELSHGDKFLTGVGLEINQACNLYCSHCFSRGGETAHHMDVETVKRVLREIREELKPFEVDIAGGEPTIHPEFEEIVRYSCGELGLPLTVSTNGTRFDDDLVDLFCEYDVDLGISLSSANAASHDDFRGMEGAFEKTVEGIRTYVDNGLNVSVRTTVTQNNFDELEDIALLSNDLGASNTYFLRFVPTGRGSDGVSDIALDNEQVKEAHRRVQSMKRDPDTYGNAILGENFPNPSSNGKSDTGFGLKLQSPMEGVTMINITSYGEVNPDHSMRHVVAGNINDSPLAEIWETSEEFQYLRQMTIDECSDCEYFGNTCVGGARQWSLLEEGRVDTKDPTCWHEPG